MKPNIQQVRPFLTRPVLRISAARSAAMRWRPTGKYTRRWNSLFQPKVRWVKRVQWAWRHLKCNFTYDIFTIESRATTLDFTYWWSSGWVLKNSEAEFRIRRHVWGWNYRQCHHRPQQSKNQSQDLLYLTTKLYSCDWMNSLLLPGNSLFFNRIMPQNKRLSTPSVCWRINNALTAY